MIQSGFSRQSHIYKKHIDSCKGFLLFYSMLKISLLTFTCLTLFISLQLAPGFLLLVAVSFFLVYSKFRHQNPRNSIPRVSNLQIVSCVYYLIKNATTSKTKLLEMLYGFCLCFTKEGLFCFKLGTKKFVVLYNPDMIQTVLSSSTLLQKRFPYEMIKPLLKEGLVTSEGSAWHSRKKLLTPSFHFRILKEFIPVFNKQARSFVKRIENLMEKHGSFDIVPLVGRCTLDIIMETAMGIRTNGEEDYENEYVEALHTWSECLSRRVALPFLWPDFIFSRTKIGKTSLKSLDVMERFTRWVINQRLRERTENSEYIRINGFTSGNDDVGRKTTRQLALLDLLLDLHMEDNTFSLQDIEDEVATFVVAGHETTATAISYILYLLGLHPDVQRSVQEEVDMILGDDVDRMITTEDIKKFKYLPCVVKESLRLYPAVPNIARCTHEDTFIKEYKINKGTTIILPIYMVHRNPEIYPNPEKFNPERFNLKHMNNRHPFAFLPFSAGPRNCIGQKFANNEMIIILATVLRHFDVSSTEHRDKITLVPDIVLTAENGLHLKFTKRQFVRNR